MALIFTELWPKTINTQKRLNWAWHDNEKALENQKAGNIVIQIPDNIPIGGVGKFLNQKMFRQGWGGGGASSFSSAPALAELLKWRPQRF